jgi:transcriptional regulator with XRE-family HTH domain
MLLSDGVQDLGGEPMPDDVAVKTGHSRALRERLIKAREARNLTQPDVVREIARIIDDGRTWTPAALSAWENFNRHPPVDVMAAWARAVGLRLVVDLDESGGRRIPVLLQPDTAELARAIDAMTDDERKALRLLLGRIRKE